MGRKANHYVGFTFAGILGWEWWTC